MYALYRDVWIGRVLSTPFFLYRTKKKVNVKEGGTGRVDKTRLNFTPP